MRALSAGSFVLIVAMSLSACTNHQRVMVDGERRPLAVGVIVDRNQSPCEQVVVSGERLRVCPAGEGKKDTIPEPR